jgi:hypothetical protein
MKTITLRLDYDTDCESPLETCDGMWTLHTFGWRDGNARLDDFFIIDGQRTIPATLDLFWKLRNGLAWIVGGVNDGYGYCHYYPVEYDSTDRINGLLVWEHDPSEMGAKTKDERKADAKSTLDEFNRWAGGEVFGYDFGGTAGEFDSCWGFIGARGDAGLPTVAHRADRQAYEGHLG